MRSRTSKFSASQMNAVFRALDERALDHGLGIPQVLEGEVQPAGIEGEHAPDIVRANRTVGLKPLGRERRQQRVGLVIARLRRAVRRFQQRGVDGARRRSS